MTIERDDDVAWIEARERGVVSDHPRAALYARLGQAIAALPDHHGGDEWKAAVLDELERADELRRARTARARRRGMFAVLASSVAIAAAAFFLVRPSDPPRVPSELTFEIGDGAARRSSGTAAIGQTLTFHGTVAGRGELWIYAGDRLVLRCPGESDPSGSRPGGCTTQPIRGGQRLDASIRAAAALPYTALLVAAPAAPPSGTLLTDAESAAPSIKDSTLIDVR